MPTKKSRLGLGCWVLIKDRYNNDKTECPRGEIGRHKGLKKPRDSQSSQSIVVSGSLKHPIKSHNFKLAFNLD